MGFHVMWLCHSMICEGSDNLETWSLEMKYSMGPQNDLTALDWACGDILGQSQNSHSMLSVTVCGVHCRNYTFAKYGHV